MPERALTKDPREQPESTTSENPLENTSVTLILLKMAERFSTGKTQSPRVANTVEDLEETINYIDYSFDYTPYQFDYSCFEIENYGDQDYVKVELPPGLRDDVDKKLDEFATTLKDPKSNQEWEEIKSKIEEERYYLEKSILLSMLAYSYDQDPQNAESSKLWELLLENRFIVY